MKENILRNITLSLDPDVVHRARMIAVERNTSLSALMRDLLLRLVEEEDGYQEAQEFCLEEMRKGYYLGAKTTPVSREDLHGRTS